MGEIIRKTIEITRALTWFERQGYITSKDHDEIFGELVNRIKATEPTQPKPFVEGLGEGWELVTDGLILPFDKMKSKNSGSWVNSNGWVGCKVEEATAYQVARKVS